MGVRKIYFACRFSPEVTRSLFCGALFELLELIGLKLKVDAVIRQEIKQEFERKVSELVAKLNEFEAIANGASGKNILVIMERTIG